jgi:hypothetical protein
VRRERSNTPLQALTLLNDMAFVECAQGLARRAIKETRDDPSDRVRHAFRLCNSRQPTLAELSRLTNLYGEFLQACRTDSEAATKLVGSAKPDVVETAEAAALVALTRCIMNLDEFVTRE